MSDNELSLIQGGVAKSVIIGAVGFIVSFIIGLFDGLSSSITCKKLCMKKN